MKSYHPLPISDAAAGRPLDICIASIDVPGPVRNGGIGTANLHLALALRDAGHRVTLLYLEETFESEESGYWEEHYRTKGLQFVHVPGRGAEPRHYCDGRTETTYSCYQWLKGKKFDIVHFHERMGIGFYSMLAKRHGLAFRNTLLSVTLHGPVWWSEPGNEEHMHEYFYLEVDHLERESVRLADVVISPSRSLLDWFESEGWELPAQTCVQPYAWHGESSGPGVPPGEGVAGTRPVDEIVFFGRLEIRKGLDIFCDALDLICEQSAGLFKVTFLGKHHTVRGVRTQDYLQERMKRWNVPCRVLSGLDTAKALDYLGGAGKIAVMPSHRDNMPLTVMECLSHGIPFITSSAGGAPEIIHHEDRDRVLFAPRTEALTDKLMAVLEHGAGPARFGIDFDENRRRWLSWHDAAALVKPAAPVKDSGDPRPLISVCLPHRDRPALLAQAIDSIKGQTYCNFEVIVVDDGSRGREAAAFLDSLEEDFRERSWKLLRLEEGRGPGKARNIAARNATGEYLFFMDDDNVAKPRELEILAGVMSRKRREVYVCAADVFSGWGAPLKDGEPEKRLLPLGSCPALGLFECRFGDTNSLVRRDWFLERGGFDERYEIDEDWEFLAKAALDGLRIEVVPESLYWYRRNPGTRQDRGSKYRKQQSLLRLYQSCLPASLRGNLAMLLGLVRRLEQSSSPPPRPEAGGREKTDTGLSSLEKVVYAASSPHFGHKTGMRFGDHLLCHRATHEAGHCIFGPDFRPRHDGPMEVRFFLEFLEGHAEDSPLATLDIYDQKSGSILALRDVTPEEVRSGRKWFSLNNAGHASQRLEFRVYWHRNSDLIVSMIEVFTLRQPISQRD